MGVYLLTFCLFGLKFVLSLPVGIELGEICQWQVELVSTAFDPKRLNHLNLNDDFLTWKQVAYS